MGNQKQIIALFKKLFINAKGISVPVLIFVIVLFVLQIFVKNLESQDINAKVLRVIDGDTIEFLNQQEDKAYKLRLFGIDAPESKQSYGKESKEYLENLIAKQDIRIQIKSKDKYQRLVGIIFLGEKDINKELVRAGFAHSYDDFSLRYLSSENYAKKNKLGLWQQENVILPKDFRKRAKQ